MLLYQHFLVSFISRQGYLAAHWHFLNLEVTNSNFPFIIENTTSTALITATEKQTLVKHCSYKQQFLMLAAKNTKTLRNRATVDPTCDGGIAICVLSGVFFFFFKKTARRRF